MAYKIGTRVKYIHHDINLGITGIVANGELHHPEADMAVKIDADAVTVYGSRVARGEVCETVSSCWVPIIPDGSNVPANQSFTELMDDLKLEMMA